jgi:hypothetical protein
MSTYFPFLATDETVRSKLIVCFILQIISCLLFNVIRFEIFKVKSSLIEESARCLRMMSVVLGGVNNFQQYKLTLN